jgi:hypothetical protein
MDLCKVNAPSVFRKSYGITVELGCTFGKLFIGLLLKAWKLD